MECVIRTPHYEAVRRPQTKTLFIVLPTDEAMSDADPERAPTRRLPVRDERGQVNYYEEAEQSIDRLWRERLGKYLYDHVVKDEMARQGVQLLPKPDKIYLANFPAHYTLWVHKKGDPHDPRRDRYLYGSRYVAQFRSPMEFCLHLKWLLDGQPMKENGRPDCRCCYCDGSVPQGEISSAFGRYHPSRRDKDKKDRDKDGGGKRPRPKASHAATSTITFKDYTKLNTTSAN
ncbi:hypothetical protein GY45DRAFT_1304915 [Cubamyces sp. BRFM 1775]|nr:hypothetical protein GY45DRAFT_1304915 [Cubamyces sp. BRFM 1775]